MTNRLRNTLVTVLSASMVTLVTLVLLRGYQVGWQVDNSRQQTLHSVDSGISEVLRIKVLVYGDLLKVPPESAPTDDDDVVFVSESSAAIHYIKTQLPAGAPDLRPKSECEFS